jgi:glyoxylase-like metal-dependent hydrolase (beta-lactamase superfamily II)
MTRLTRVTEHVYWLPPGRPDRPSLCAVAGNRRTLMLDGGSSRAHASDFLRALAAEGAAHPFAVVYTHSHWDHVFGGIEVGAPIVAHASTAERLVALAAMDWSDEGLDRRVETGQVSPEHVANVKEELPAPRIVDVAPADFVFRDGLEIELGGANVTVRHLGGDHSAESSVMYVEPDRVLFLGDCTYPSLAGVLTRELAFPLHEAILAFGAEHHVEGHHPAVVSRHDCGRVPARARAARREDARSGASSSPRSDDRRAGRGHRLLLHGVHGRTRGGVAGLIRPAAPTDLVVPRREVRVGVS